MSPFLDQNQIANEADEGGYICNTESLKDAILAVIDRKNHTHARKV